MKGVIVSDVRLTRFADCASSSSASFDASTTSGFRFFAFFSFAVSLLLSLCSSVSADPPPLSALAVAVLERVIRMVILLALLGFTVFVPPFGGIRPGVSVLVGTCGLLVAVRTCNCNGIV